MTLLPWRALTQHKASACHAGKVRRPGAVCRARLRVENLEDRCVPATVFWTNPGGGDWDTGANWDTGTKPGPGDDAVIDLAGITVTHNQSQTDAVNSLTSQAALSISSGTLSLASDSTIRDALTLTNATLTGAGTVTVSGPLTWSNGTMSGTGATNADGGLTISGGTTLDRRALNNAAVATWTGFSFLCQNSCAFNNLAGASFDDRADAGWVQVGGGSFNNAGTFTKSSSGSASFAAAFNNTGTVSVQSGTLSLTGGSSTGSFTVAVGAVLAFNGGTVNLNTGSSVGGAGGVTVSTGTVNAAGSYHVTGPTIISGGTANFSGTDITTGALTLGSGATLTGTGTVTVNGLLTWAGGTMSGPGVTTAAGGLVIGGTISKTLDARTLNNAAAATWSSTNNFECQNACTFENLAGASFDDLVGAIWEQRSGTGGRFLNAGTFTKSSSSITTNFSVPFNNTGTVLVQSGTLSLNAGGVSSGHFTVAAGTALIFQSGSFNLDAGSGVGGAGNVTVNAATVNVAGRFDVTGTTAINNGTANFSSDVGIATLNLTGGTLGGTGAVTVSGLLTWSGGTMSGPGTTNADGGLTIGGGTLDTRVLNNAAAATWNSSGVVSCNNGCTFNNLPGASFDDQFDSGWRQDIGTGGSFNNAGTFTKSGGSLVTNFAVAFNNTGTLLVQAGTLNLTGGGTSTGNFMVPAGTGLTFASGAHDLQTGSSVRGAGTVGFGGTVNVAGSYDIAGGTNVIGGAVSFTGQIADVGALTIRQGTADFGGNDINPTMLTLSGGTLTGTGAVTVSGLLTWSGGTMSGPGVTNAAGGLVIDANNAKTLDTRTLNNAAAATWAGSGLVFCDNDCTFNNLPGAGFDDQTFAFWLQHQGTGGRFHNAGNFTKSADSDTAVFGVDFTNDGTLDVEAGGLRVSADFRNAGLLNVGPSSTFTAAGRYSQTGTVRVQAAGTLALQGPFANFKNGHTLAGGTYDIAGTFQFTGANIVTNRAALTLDGPDARVVDENGNDGLANLARNAAGASLAVLNGASLTTAGDFTDRGTVTVGAGSTFTVGGTYTEMAGLTSLSGGTLAAVLVSVRRGGTLSGIGTVDANVRNAGQLLVGGADTTGVLTVTGDFTQTAAGVLTLAVGGLTAGTEYDQLAIGGTAALDGALNVSLVNGFVPPSGSTYEILTFAAARGAFATLNIDPSFLPPVYDPTDVTLQAT